MEKISEGGIDLVPISLQNVYRLGKQSTPPRIWFWKPTTLLCE